MHAVKSWSCNWFFFAGGDFPMASWWKEWNLYIRENAWFNGWIIFERINFGLCGMWNLWTKEQYKGFFKQYQVRPLQLTALLSNFSTWNRTCTYEERWVQTSRDSDLEGNFLKFEVEKVLIWPSNNSTKSKYAGVMFLISTSMGELKLIVKRKDEFAESYETNYLQIFGVVEQGGLQCIFQKYRTLNHVCVCKWRKINWDFMIVIMFVVRVRKFNLLMTE